MYFLLLRQGIHGLHVCIERPFEDWLPTDRSTQCILNYHWLRFCHRMSGWGGGCPYQGANRMRGGRHLTGAHVWLRLQPQVTLLILGLRPRSRPSPCPFGEQNKLQASDLRWTAFNHSCSHLFTVSSGLLLANLLSLSRWFSVNLVMSTALF